MSILNVTNLTSEPHKWIEEKFLDAFEEVEKELDVTIAQEEKFRMIDGAIDYLEDVMNESKGSELLGIIDNYLVNHDYYAEVKEWVENR